MDRGRRTGHADDPGYTDAAAYGDADPAAGSTRTACGDATAYGDTDPAAAGHAATHGDANAGRTAAESRSRAARSRAVTRAVADADPVIAAGTRSDRPTATDAASGAVPDSARSFSAVAADPDDAASAAPPAEPAAAGFAAVAASGRGHREFRSGTVAAADADTGADPAAIPGDADPAHPAAAGADVSASLRG